MFPAQFPRELANDPRRSAERKVFKALKESLSDDFMCFYSRPWWGLDSSGAEKNGEADFVVAHKNLGIIFIEVKGGRVSFDPASDSWLSIDRHNFARPIKDPIDQAMNCMFRFLDLFKKDQIWPSAPVKITHGAIFTDTKTPPLNKQVVGKHRKELFLFGDSFPEGLDSWIRERLSPGGKEIPPGPAGLQVLQRVIADPTKLSFSLRTVIDGETAEMDQYLIGVQHHVINSVLKEPRSVVIGGAGTGKTVVAIELCARLAAGGQRVLFTTKSKNLAALVEKVIRHDDVVVQQWSPEGVPWKIGEEFDALIVDEGQDFDHAELREILNFVQERKLAVFLDSNQAILNDPRQIAERLDATEFALNINLRNTRAISRVTASLFEGDLPETVGPEGTAPELQTDAEGIARVAVDQILIAVEKGIRISQLAVIADTSSLREELIRLLRDAGIPTFRYLDWQPESVTAETIVDFKGLESDFLVVVLSQPNSISIQHAYVAASRARSRLLLVAKSNAGPLVQAVELSSEPS